MGKIDIQNSVNGSLVLRRWVKRGGPRLRPRSGGSDNRVRGVGVLSGRAVGATGPPTSSGEIVMTVTGRTGSGKSLGDSKDRHFSVRRRPETVFYFSFRNIRYH